MVMGQNNLLYGNLAKTGRNPFNFFNDKSIRSRIYKGIDIADKVPVPQKQI